MYLSDDAKIVLRKHSLFQLRSQFFTMFNPNDFLKRFNF